MQHTTTLRGPPLGKKKKRRGLKAAEGEPEPPEEGGARGGEKVWEGGEGVVRERNRHQ